MGWCCQRGKGNFGVNLEHPIVTNGDFAAYLRESDALFPDCFVFLLQVQYVHGFYLCVFMLEHF